MSKSKLSVSIIRIKEMNGLFWQTAYIMNKQIKNYNMKC